jgi:hypothetical protein
VFTASSRLRRYANSAFSWLKSRKTRSRLGGDATSSEGLSFIDGQTAASPTIWVNVFDPINGPSFQPSPLKPIPWSMQSPEVIPTIFLPHRTSSLNKQLGTPPPLRTSSRSGTSTICPSRSTTPVPGRDGTWSSSGVLNTPDRALLSQSPGPSPLHFKRVSTLVKEEPLRHPSSLLHLQRRKSESHASAYLTPPEFADEAESTTPEPAQLVAEIHRLIRQVPTQSSECDSDKTDIAEAPEPELEAANKMKIDKAASHTVPRRNTVSSTMSNILDSPASEHTTQLQLEVSSARTSLDVAHRNSRLTGRRESRKVRNAVGTELRRLFSKK